MTDTIHSCSPFCTLPACVKQREHQDFQAWHGGIYAGRQKEIAFGAWQAATERATAQQDVNRLDFLSKQVYRWHTGDGGYSARLKFRWEDSIIETSLRDAIDAAIRIAGDGIHTCTPPKDKP